MLEVQAARERRPRELVEVKTRLEMAEQLRIKETMQKKALQEESETEKNKSLNETTGLEKRETKAENDAEQLHARSESKSKTKDNRPDAFGR